MQRTDAERTAEVSKLIEQDCLAKDDLWWLSDGQSMSKKALAHYMDLAEMIECLNTDIYDAYNDDTPAVSYLRYAGVELTVELSEDACNFKQWGDSKMQVNLNQVELWSSADESDTLLLRDVDLTVACGSERQ